MSWRTEWVLILPWFYRLLGLCVVGSAVLLFYLELALAARRRRVLYSLRRIPDPQRLGAYRDIIDQQFPGAYLIELVGMWIFGTSSVAWRVYDFTLLAFASVSFFVVTRTAEVFCNGVSDSRVPGRTRTPGIFSACLFILIHGRHGLEQGGGQRDFAVAVLLLGATALLRVAVRRNSPLCAPAFGLFSGAAFTIKPTPLPLSLAQLLFACFVYHKRQVRWFPSFASASLGFLIAPVTSIIFLIREQAFGRIPERVPRYSAILCQSWASPA